MTTTLSVDERQQLTDTARELLAKRSAPARVRETIESTPGVDRELWTQFVELGWTSIHIAEEHGGTGCTWSDLAAVLHETGRAITPSPLLASAVLATGALQAVAGHPLAASHLAALAAGEEVGTVALASVDGSYDVRSVGVEAAATDGGFRLQGRAGYVLDADLADIVVVFARTADGAVAPFLLDAGTPGVSLEPTPPVDRTRRLFTVTVDCTVGADRLLCEPGPESRAIADRVVALGVTAACTDAVGATEHVLEQATAYACERTQFGQPIGSFQAVKHHCADIAIAVETSRAAVNAAWRAFDTDPDAALHDAAVAGSYVGPACSEACGVGLVVFGGIGFTWEHDVHLYLKRAKLDEVLFGTPSWHRRRIAAQAFDSSSSHTRPDPDR